MKKFIVGVIVLFFVFSCQQNDITKDKTDYGQTYQIYLQKKDNGISMDMIPENPDTGGQGGSGGGAISTPNLTLYNVFPYLLKPYNSALFTWNGSVETKAVGINLAPNGIYYDYFQHDNLSPTWLYLGADYEEDNIHYVAQGYVFGHVNGYSDFFPQDAKVRVVLSGGGIGDYNKWKEGKGLTDYSGPILGEWVCGACTNGAGAVEGKMTVTYLNVTESGELNLSYVLKVGGKTFNVYKNKYRRVPY